MIADLLELKPGQKVLDVGCGVGGPMRAVAQYSRAHVTGITINDYQVSMLYSILQCAVIVEIKKERSQELG